jgi:hypothetical protein
MTARRKQAQAALDAAQKALDAARNAVADGRMHPTLVRDHIAEVERWTYHAKEHMRADQIEMAVEAAALERDRLYPHGVIERV